MKSKSSQFALPYLTLTLSVFVCLGAISDASATTVNLNLRTGEMVLQSREDKLIAELMRDLAKSVQQLKPKTHSQTSSVRELIAGYDEQTEVPSSKSQQELLTDPGRYLHQTLLNLPPPLA